MWVYTFSLIVLLLGSFCHAETSQMVIQFTPKNEKDFNAIRNIKKVLDFEPDFLVQPRQLNKSGSILLQDDTLIENAVNYLDQNGIENKLLKVAKAALKEVKLDFANLTAIIENYYLSYDQQQQLINHFQTKYPEFVKNITIGYSYENKSIIAVKFGFPGNNKPIFWVNAGIHAREWIGHSTAFYFINQLSTNPEWLEILKKIDIVVTPNANPDGYEYSRTTQRMWRTNRNMLQSGCYGVDLNRNFPFKWRPWNESSVNDFCTVSKYRYDRETYPGARPASEPEIQALTGAMEGVRQRLKGFIDLHSYGRVILVPWGHAKKTYPVDLDDLEAVANKMKEAIHQERQTVYAVQNSAGLYPAAGASDDYSKDLGIKYVYVMELTEGFDFAAPEELIAPVGKEITRALKVLAEQIVKEFTS